MLASVNFSDLYKVSQETIRSDLRYFQKSGMLQRCYGGGILNRDALSKLITENKIDISSTIATPIHQDAKLRRGKHKKSRQGMCFRLIQY
ncbi:ribokinase [Salmonella enterica subsp. enterica]|uniref:Ribokinase n=1 Tax=Salmonella enterica I TaxID=59201 RepID=A0A3S4HCN2_SALET|nr:ribokinase [Salmonella enterica subsp. enterica]